MTEISIFSEEQTSNMEQSFAYAQEDISGVMVLKKTLFNHFNHGMVGSHHLLVFSKFRKVLSKKILVKERNFCCPHPGNKGRLKSSLSSQCSLVQNFIRDFVCIIFYFDSPLSENKIIQNWCKRSLVLQLHTANFYPMKTTWTGSYRVPAGKTCTFYEKGL